MSKICDADRPVSSSILSSWLGSLVTFKWFIVFSSWSFELFRGVTVEALLVENCVLRLALVLLGLSICLWYLLLAPGAGE